MMMSEAQRVAMEAFMTLDEAQQINDLKAILGDVLVLSGVRAVKYSTGHRSKLWGSTAIFRFI
jgi:tRNA C32,U32 (ribose-2'-O)-methylase TrmJ